MNDELGERSGHGSAVRSVLLTILGEYVAPDDRPVFRDGLVRGLEDVGYGRQAARQALARSVDRGWITSERVGRRSRVRLTPAALEMLRAGYPRIYGFGAPWHWDGHWLLLIVRVSEARREIRDRLRTQLTWEGFGTLGGGVWISPHTDRFSEDRPDGVAGSSSVLAFTAELTTLGRPRDVIDRAWDLDDVARHYRSFLAEFAALRPSGPAETFRAQTAMVHAWRKFPFIDPDLPKELLPGDWPRDEARELFLDRHARWAPAAEDHFHGLAE
jgi:phenylacetic acid degradation operon negative regulatory protein